MSVQAIVKILQSQPKEQVTAAINKVIASSGQPEGGFNALSIPGDNGSKLLTQALGARKLVELLNSDISGDLNPVQVAVLANFGLQQGWFKDFMASKKMEGENLAMDAAIPGQDKLTLLDTATMHGKLDAFIKHATGQVDLSKLVECGKNPIPGMRTDGDHVGKVSVASVLLATNQFTSVPQDKLTGTVNIGDPSEGTLYLYHAIQGGGQLQWDALVESNKLSGMLENFNALVPYRNHEAPLVFVLAQNNMLDGVLGYLAQNGMLQFTPDIEGDGTDIREYVGIKEIHKHFKNELDLGSKKFPDRAITEQVKFGNGELEVVTPLFMYQIDLSSTLIPNMVAQGKLVMNLSGDVFETAVRYIQSIPSVEVGGVWFKAVIYAHQAGSPEGLEMLEVAALISGGPKESAHAGKLVYGCMPKNILPGCVKACKGSAVKSHDSARQMSVDPFSSDTFYWLKPFMAAAAQAVTVEYLMDHGLSEEAAKILLGKTDFAEGVPAHYWDQVA